MAQRITETRDRDIQMSANLLRCFKAVHKLKRLFN